MHILALSGSLRSGSHNTALVRLFSELAPAATTIEHAQIGNLPLFNQDLEASFPQEAQALKDKIRAADALIIATPEYNRSIPGVLKNAIDWASRPYGDNAFAGKVVLIVGVSIGKIGTAVAQSHLREVMLYLDAQVIGQPEVYLGPAADIFAEDGSVPEETRAFLAKALETLLSRVETKA